MVRIAPAFWGVKSYWICGEPVAVPVTLDGVPRLLATAPVPGSRNTWRRYALVAPVLRVTLPLPSGPFVTPPRYGVLVGFISSTQNRTRTSFVGGAMSVVFSAGSLAISLYASLITS